jgi:hypothetical protein
MKSVVAKYSFVPLLWFQIVSSELFFLFLEIECFGLFHNTVLKLTTATTRNATIGFVEISDNFTFSFSVGMPHWS